MWLKGRVKKKVKSKGGLSKVNRAKAFFSHLIIKMVSLNCCSIKRNYINTELFLIFHHLDVKESCHTLKEKCVETGGNCVLDKNEVIQCECPDDTQFIDGVGCSGKAFKYIINMHSLLKFINFVLYWKKVIF